LSDRHLQLPNIAPFFPAQKHIDNKAGEGFLTGFVVDMRTAVNWKPPYAVILTCGGM